MGILFDIFAVVVLVLACRYAYRGGLLKSAVTFIAVTISFFLVIFTADLFVPAVRSHVVQGYYLKQAAAKIALVKDVQPEKGPYQTVHNAGLAQLAQQMPAPFAQLLESYGVEPQQVADLLSQAPQGASEQQEPQILDLIVADRAENASKAWTFLLYFVILDLLSFVFSWVLCNKIIRIKVHKKERLPSMLIGLLLALVLLCSSAVCLKPMMTIFETTNNIFISRQVVNKTLVYKYIYNNSFQNLIK